MKTRIISAAVMIAVVLAFLFLGFYVSGMFIGIFIALIASIGVFELVSNAAGIKQNFAKTIAVLYAVIKVFCDLILGEAVVRLNLDWPVNITLAEAQRFISGALLAVYFLAAVVIILSNHKDFDLGRIFTLSAAVPLLVKGFCYLGKIVAFSSGFYYLLLIVIFANICDTGAYFTGVTIGKHKLCPEISPKKTVEGAIGGIVSSLICVVILILVFKNRIGISQERAILTFILTVPFCIIGMLGDLFASQVKRSVGLKDYGNLIPGHGGILDRFDSMLLISPLLYILMCSGVI